MTEAALLDDPEYAKKVAQQIGQYAEGFDPHALPAAFHLWSGKHLLPGLAHVFGPGDMHDFYATPFVAAAVAGRRPRYLSIGCGDGSNEIAVARRMVERGLTDFEFVCTDLSAGLIERIEQALDPEMRRRFTLRTVDLNRLDDSIQGLFEGVMASHSLHHLVELERVFGWVKSVLRPGAVFAINDMIGRNGHMRWHETAIFIRMLWPLLDERKRYHHQLKRTYEVFEDFDCSDEGFEGVRAQDILPLLVKTFHPRRFFATGGVIDPFIDRGFGHGFDLSSNEDRRLLEFIGELNDALLDCGQIRPTLMLAYFVAEPCEELYYRSRSAAASVRDPAARPAWSASYPSVPMLKRT